LTPKPQKPTRKGNILGGFGLRLGFGFETRPPQADYPTQTMPVLAWPLLILSRTQKETANVNVDKKTENQTGKRKDRGRAHPWVGLGLGLAVVLCVGLGLSLPLLWPLNQRPESLGTITPEKLSECLHQGVGMAALAHGPILDHFQKLVSTPIPIPQEHRADREHLATLLSSPTEKSVRRGFSVPQDMTLEAAMKSAIQPFRGGQLLLNEELTVLVTPEGQKSPSGSEEEETGLNAFQRARLTAALLHETGNELALLPTQESQDLLVFMAINSLNLRYMGAYDGVGYDDKSYPELWKALEKLPSPEFHATLWDTLMKGYDPQGENLTPLTRDQVLALHDCVGIFIAEEYRLKQRKTFGWVTQILPGTSLIILHLANGGEIPESALPGMGGRNKTLPPHDHRGFEKAFPAFDEMITKEISENQPLVALVANLRFGAPDEKGGYLRKLVDLVENPEANYNRLTKWITGKILAAIAENAQNHRSVAAGDQPDPTISGDDNL
jgi:hypothetical protein